MFDYKGLASDYCLRCQKYMASKYLLTRLFQNNSNSPNYFVLVSKDGEKFVYLFEEN